MKQVKPSNDATVHELTDRELLFRICSGDNDAFDEFFRRYQRFVWHKAFLLTENRQDTEDLSQEIMLKLWRGASSYRGEAHVPAWVSSIVRNACADWLRKKATRIKTESYPTVSDDGETVTFEPEDTSPALRADTALNASVDRELILSAIRSLPEDRQEVLLLRDIEGMKYDEIARQLQIDIGTVKSRISRARAQLREKLLELGFFV